MKEIIGFSTGDLLDIDYPLQKALDNMRKIGANAVEFKIGDHYQYFWNSIDSLDFDGFDSISIHGPKFSKIGREHKRIFNYLEKIHQKIELGWVVFHPDEIDKKDLVGYNFPIAIENNDWNKKSGKDIEELKDLFSEKNVKFVMDVNHCFTLDKSMSTASAMADVFKNKLCGVHVSGIETLPHEPLYKTKQIDIINAVPRNVPIIIESFRSAYENLDEAQTELNYIKENLFK
jgi:sugar phosphate isomerase/epimerase